MYNPLPYLPEKFQKFIQTLKDKKIPGKIIFFTLGILSTIWFLIRVIPKPSRAAYPCMQATAPYMAGFVLWLSSLFSSALFLVKFRKSLAEHKLIYAGAFFTLFIIGIFINASINPKITFANSADYEKVEWKKTGRLSGLKGNMTTNIDEVAIVKSQEEYAADITMEEIEVLVRQAIDMTGGLSGIVSNGDYVVLKPNLVAVSDDQDPNYIEVSGMATDWRVTKAVAKIVRELNPDGTIFIIESSAEPSTRDVLDYYNYTTENFPEVDAIIAYEDSCGVYWDYNDEHLETLLLDDDIRLYPDEAKPNLSPEFYMARVYYNADVVISIPVLKNHLMAIITGGTKNVSIGMAPTSIYANSETSNAKWIKIDHGFENLHKWLHDYYLLKPVDFVVIDGLQGFDHGPVGIDELTMEEMQHNMRLILAGKEALSVDAVCGNIMSLDPSFANYMVYLDQEEYHVGTIDPRFIRVKGKKIQEIRELFPHNSDVTNAAIYTDYTAPIIDVSDPVVEGNTISFEIGFDEDLNKLELEVNGILIDEVCIGEFSTVTFEVDEELLPFEDAKLIAYDRFYNQSEMTFDLVGLKEHKIPVLLQQNYPNPFSSSTTICFTLDKPQLVNLYITNINGQMIESIINKNLEAGNHQYNWGSEMTKGVYLLTLEIEGKKITQQMIKQ